MAKKGTRIADVTRQEAVDDAVAAMKRFGEERLMAEIIDNAARTEKREQGYQANMKKCKDAMHKLEKENAQLRHELTTYKEMFANHRLQQEALAKARETPTSKSPSPESPPTTSTPPSPPQTTDQQSAK